jgi:histidinol-phosphatase (PHP family)
MTTNPFPVSVHGGHSGQFCNHAKNSLEEIVRAYIDRGYPWVGITEHMPPASDAYLYPEEKQAGLDADAILARFAEYMTVCRRLQSKYADRIEILVGFETEYYEGSIDLVRRLIGRFSPDYVVGSVHHVKEVPFDYSPEKYREASDRCGGLDRLYAAYFDQQFEMLRALKPRVVGHLDLIRIYDPEYSARLVKPSIWEKILRNLEWVKRLGLILDLNLRPLSRGEEEPYLSAPILKQAIDMGIDVVPGDDSHGIDTIGKYMAVAIEMLQAAGAPTDWRSPVDRP